MRTSNKLLLALFIFIILGIVVVNVILRKEIKSSELIQAVDTSENDSISLTADSVFNK